MLYSENELNKRLRSGCGLYYFYAADEALVHTAAQKALKVLNEDDPSSARPPTRTRTCRTSAIRWPTPKTPSSS